jgi:hypothetical protein
VLHVHQEVGTVDTQLQALKQAIVLLRLRAH